MPSQPGVLSVKSRKTQNTHTKTQEEPALTAAHANDILEGVIDERPTVPDTRKRHSGGRGRRRRCCPGPDRTCHLEASIDLDSLAEHFQPGRAVLHRHG